MNSNVKQLSAESLRELARDNKHLEKLVQFWSDDKLIHHLAARILELQKPVAKTHYLKITPDHFAAVEAGVKIAEFRINDRDFSVGDVLVLQEWGDGGYSGAQVTRVITHITDLSEYLENYAMLSMR